MQHEIISRPPASRPIAIEVDGEPLGVVVPSSEGYRFLAVRYAAFPLDGRIFESVEEARLTLGAAIHADDAA
ncbi:MAG: hypothetical protein J0I48_08465 [Devosia sp.]|jgi:hypothetical protein|uniref:hypothetical protein n=1 Tax=unclassified Devosia TaxID=196773 RepID=UPI00092A108C|nr:MULTISPECIES: hypothetical protein [unclassified Devosia]MBL8598475.1 hypothetical protein [Devosia sp.]MBN9346220.1 hypothetical protein [Devosia sp.]OJX55320.1 MAG: hypothetical protein BGO81_08545 [Devosia sp. 66-22]